MHMGSIDTTKRIQYRRNPYTGDVEYRYVWEESDLGGLFSSAWKSIKGAGSKIVEGAKSVIKVALPIVAIGVGIVNPAAGAKLGAAIKAYDTHKAAKAAESIAASAGEPVEIPSIENVQDKAAYKKWIVELERANAAGEVSNVRFAAKKLNELARVSAPRWDGGVMQPTPPYAGSPPGSIGGPLIAESYPARELVANKITYDRLVTLYREALNNNDLAWSAHHLKRLRLCPTTPNCNTPEMQALEIAQARAAETGVPYVPPKAAGFGNIPMPLLLGGAALLFFMMQQK